MSAELDKPVENCGIVGIIDLQGREAVHRAVAMLTELTNRGQDACGIATKNHGFHRHRQMGLVPQVFTKRAITEHSLEGSLVIGHTRYRIQGGDTMEFTQPVLVDSGRCEIALAHNGNVEDLDSMRQKLALRNVDYLDPDYDSNYLAHVIAYAPGRSYIEKIQNGLKGVDGSYSLIIATNDGHLLGVRDPWANRPLSMTQQGNVWAIASETSAFQAIGATDMSRWYEFGPGEIIDISAKGVQRSKLLEKAEPRKCVFEGIYLGLDTSVMDGETNGEFRARLGESLAENHPGDGEVVTAIPEASRSAAHGYAHVSGLPEAELVKKNPHSVGRSFIAGEMKDRRAMIESKFKISPAVKGREIVLVDDSIVCGNTSEILFDNLTEKFGAGGLHARSTAPKVIADCQRGVSMRSRDGRFLAVDELTGRTRTDQEMAEMIGAKTIAFLELSELQGALEEGGRDPKTYCFGCFGGQEFGPLIRRNERPIAKEFVWPNS